MTLYLLGAYEEFEELLPEIARRMIRPPGWSGFCDDVGLQPAQAVFAVAADALGRRR